MKKKTKIILSVSVILTLAMGTGAWMYLRYYKSLPSKEQKALWACHDRAKRHLKSPGTAKWPTLDSQGVILREHKEGEATMLLSTYVDAQNSFGAMVRTELTCYLKPDGKDWQVVKIDVGK